MRDIHCPKDIGFENTFYEEDCKREQFYNNCYHCWSTAIAKEKEKWNASILDKVREDIEDTLYVDSLIFGELIDFRNGKISADDVIDEFNRVTRLEVLKILDKHKEKEK